MGGIVAFSWGHSKREKCPGTYCIKTAHENVWWTTRPQCMKCDMLHLEYSFLCWKAKAHPPNGLHNREGEYPNSNKHVSDLLDCCSTNLKVKFYSIPHRTLCLCNNYSCTDVVSDIIWFVTEFLLLPWVSLQSLSCLFLSLLASLLAHFDLFSVNVEALMSNIILGFDLWCWPLPSTIP